VVVIGAGIIGAAIALRLQSQGRSVMLLDRDEPGRGASFGNMACIAVTEFLPVSGPSIWKKLPRWLLEKEGPVHVRPGALLGLSPWLLRFIRAGLPRRRAALARAGSDLCRRATQDFHALATSAAAQDLVSGTEGALRLYPEAQDKRDDEDSLAEFRELGFEHQPLTPRELRDLEPGLSDNIHSGCLLPQWLLVRNPFEFTRRVIRAFTARGGVVERADVRGFVTNGRQLSGLTLASGQVLPANRTVLACGAWTGQLTRQLRDPIPLATERGYHTQISEPGIALRRPLIIPRHGYAISPVCGGIRVGGTVELGGLEAPPNYARARILVQRAKRLLPGLQTAKHSEWMGHRPAFPDTIPLISKASHFDNAYYATGHGHLGLTLAATTSVLIDELIAGKMSSADPATLGIGRFSSWV